MSRFDQREERQTTRYRKMRAAFLAENPLCAECERNGRYRPATELDHIVPLHRDPSPENFWGEREPGLQGLCEPCHLRKTELEHHRKSDERRRKEARFERVRAILAVRREGGGTA